MTPVAKQVNTNKGFIHNLMMRKSRELLDIRVKAEWEYRKNKAITLTDINRLAPFMRIYNVGADGKRGEAARESDAGMVSR